LHPLPFSAEDTLLLCVCGGAGHGFLPSTMVSLKSAARVPCLALPTGAPVQQV
jgi:hypothetical protein